MLVVVVGHGWNGAEMGRTGWAGVEGAPTGAFDRCRSTVPDLGVRWDTPRAVRSERTEEKVIVYGQK